MAMMDAAGVGPKTFQQLLMNIGPPENCLCATYDELESIPRIKEKGARLLLDAFDSLDEYNDSNRCYLHKGISMLSFFDDDYPQILRQIDDPPPAIYIKGDIRSLNLNLIALVGTTQASQSGLRMAVDISKQFVARGFGIIFRFGAGNRQCCSFGGFKSGRCYYRGSRFREY